MAVETVGREKNSVPFVRNLGGVPKDDSSLIRPVKSVSEEADVFSDSDTLLHEEFVDLYDWLKPWPLERVLRFSVFNRIKKVLLRLWPDAKIRPFGSLHTGLFLPTSDIDVLVEDNTLPPDYLERTAKELRSSGMAENIVVVDTASVPIVKMVDADTEIFLDISFNTAQGLRAADYINEMRISYPLLEPLVFILKQFLVERNLNQTFTGGLSSYGLVLLIINFLQIGSSEDYRKKTMKEVNMGLVLLKFFQFYGQDFNYVKLAIRISDGGSYPLREELRRQMSRVSGSLLCIEDPLQPENDIGHSSHNFMCVRQAFEQALWILSSVFVCASTGRCKWWSGYKGSLLAFVFVISEKHIRYREWLQGRLLADNAPARLSPLIPPEITSPLNWSQLFASAPPPIIRRQCSYSSALDLS
ncbi:unnamed protein product [Enterobius vermicularis]|uniref:polynucleotide adenylyltransferase n=1 Tax=Enterobius vermicularis TaxID=51028 RepID=A0A0N4VBB4_ENTVE|nr:unnamed protein product [Enterobius vermicularis]